MCTRAVSGLAHYLEREAIPTAVIGAIRDHVTLLRPPRALVVPFELGRPFGAPDAPDFQRRVLHAALGLLERTDGPVVCDFTDSPPAPAAGIGDWTPPDLPRRAPPVRDPNVLAAAVLAEMAQLGPLRDRWVRDHHGRQFDRITRLAPDRLVALITAYTQDQSIASPLPPYTTAQAIKFAADDLKHFYYQAGLSRPGGITDIALDDWVFGATMAGEMLLRLRAALLASDDPELQQSGGVSIIPSHQAHREPRL